MSQNAVPLINVSTQNDALKNEILEAINQVIQTSSFVLGPAVKAFEDQFQAYTKVKHAISCSSGSEALLLPLMAENIGPGDEVLVPSFTFYATAGAVARLGATPVFVDSDASYNICLKDLQKKITKKTKAIIPVHLFGQMVDIPAIQSMIKASGQSIFIIEDCAQSMGAEFNGIQAGCFGEYGAYSFYPTKNLGAMGDAGMMSARDDIRAEKLRMMRVHGSKQRYYHELVGVNSRLDSMQAAVLGVKIKHLREYENNREKLANHYNKLFKEANISGVQLPVVGENRRHVWNQYTIRAQKRDELKKFLADNQIGSEIYYPLAMHKQKAFIGGASPISLPICESLEREVLSLPMFPELKLEQVERVVECVTKFYR